MAADEGGNENWSEAVEDLVENGDVDGAISLLESVVSKLTSLIASSSEQGAHLQLATALGELADLHSCKGLSLKADELRSHSLLIRSSFLHPESRRHSGSFEEKVVMNQESGNGTSSNQCQEEDDDWERIADLDTSLEKISLNAQSEKGAALDPSNVIEPSASPRRRGRGSFLYRKNELYSDQLDDGVSIEDDSFSIEGSSMFSERYGTGHVILLYDFPPTTRTTQLERLFDKFRHAGFSIRWVSDSVALAVFRTTSAAEEAQTSMEFPFKVRRLEEKDMGLLNISYKDLEPPLVRPKTSVRTAQRLISHAMGIENPSRSSPGSDEFRQQEAARKSRILERQNLRHDAWGGPN